jgi:hypothetical protein
MSEPLTDAQVREKLNAFDDGTRICVKYFNRLDRTTLRSAVGEIFADEDSWILRRTSTSMNRFPSADLMVMSIRLDASRTSRSRAREDELVAMATPVVIDNPELFMQARRPQPPAEAPSTQAPSNPNAMEMMRMMLEHMNKQASEHSSQIASLAALVKQNASTQQAPVQTMNRSAIGSDVQSIMNLTDAIKGQDNPTWRLAPGLILQRFITNRFKIFSIPHLLFKEDPSTGEMVKVPSGQAMSTYESLLTKYKLTFPNSVATATAKRSSKEPTTGAMSNEGAAGVFAQVDRAERMFVDLLNRLDQVSDASLPSSKEEWRLFLDAGVAVEELYATLSHGFLKGGAKIAQAHNVAIETTGRFDPATLWPKEDKTSEFRKQ